MNARTILVGHAIAVVLLAALLVAGCGRKDASEKTPDAVLATPAVTESPTDTPEPQLQQAGASVASQGVASAGVPPCTSCHGAGGEGNAAAGFPRIGGQPRAYIRRQLDAYADGTRSNPVMMPIAKNLTPALRDAVAAYYSTLEAPAPAASEGKANARGAQLSAVGDEAKQVQACANCHGPEGRGAPPSYPALAGQHPTYLVAALKEWKDGSRKTDPSGQMPSIAAALDDADIEALAQFFASKPSPPADARLARPALPRR